MNYIKTGFILENIKASIDCDDLEILNIASNKLSSLSEFGEILKLELYKKSVDARKKDNIHFVCSVSGSAYVKAGTDEKELRKRSVKLTADSNLSFKCGNRSLSGRPIIVGFGPAGMFAALILSRYGYNPLVLERGGDVDSRCNAVKLFEEKGILDTECNVQFGAGGAGTFSDGKLTTRINDPYVRHVLKTLYDLGAPEDVLWRAKPHIGTDILRNVVKNVHKEIVKSGGEIRYNSRVDAFGEGYVTVGGEKIYSDAVILATGHSARELYGFAVENGYELEAKPFSVGVRIEHLQSELDLAMHGREDLWQRLGHAEYSLSYRKGERGVYSFCMCPGGKVVASSSENGGVVTNGMSEYFRDGANANAAIAVSVLPSDLGGNITDGIEFQRNLERAAFRHGGENYFAPCQSIEDFYLGKKGKIPSRIKPTYRDGRVTPADFNEIFPTFVSAMLKDGLREFGKKIKGFNSNDVPLTGVETRTSAPVRILRNPVSYEAIGKKGIYPCGEGAGYAGGIVSAAVDGIRVAGAIITEFSPE